MTLTRIAQFSTLFLLTTFAFLAPARGEPPATKSSLDQQDLFTACAGGYTTYRIPGLLITPRGTILAYCEARKLKGYDWDPIDILLRRSTDGGKTWDAPAAIAVAPADAAPNPVSVAHKLGGHGVTLDNPIMIASADGGVHFLYCVNYGRCFYRKSSDDGKTFSDPVEITAALEKLRPQYDWKVCATGPGHGIRLTTGPHAGRLLTPVWLSTGTGNNGHHPSATTTLYSDDNGKTWQSGDIAASSKGDVIDPNETEAVQLADGRVMFNTRTDSPKNRRLIQTSPDGASHWSAPAFDAHLFDPICFASLINLPSSPAHPAQHRLLFCNPDSSDAKRKGTMQPRRNLTIRISEDDGKTWPTSRVLDPGVAGYNDTAAAVDGTVYCLYERGGLKDMFDTGFLTIIRLPPDWVMGKP